MIIDSTSRRVSKAETLRYLLAKAASLRYPLTTPREVELPRQVPKPGVNNTVDVYHIKNRRV
jgi:hypothetical protein